MADQLTDLIIYSVGIAAAVLTTASFLPQIIKAYRTKRMGDISSYLMGLYAGGTTLWMIYGIFKMDFVILGANVVATGLNLLLLSMKFRYPKSSEDKP